MVALTATANTYLPPSSSSIPLIDLSKPDSKNLIVKACEELGFFKLINHGIPTELITKLESEALKFFSLPLSEKQKARPANPFGYGNKRIGPNGDVGWVEYLLIPLNPDHLDYDIFDDNSTNNLRNTVRGYVSAVRKMGCEILELMAEGLKIEKDELSRLLKDEKSDSMFRVNYYPPCPENQNGTNNLVGFGEHTDPQIISILRSNNTSGLEISLKDGSWVSVPPDHNSFFINVGDSLQVMTNGRFRSVRHRVLIRNKLKSRISMIYFGGPPVSEKIGPLPSLIGDDDDEDDLHHHRTSLYKEFTWVEYKKFAYNLRLADNRLIPFQN